MNSPPDLQIRFLSDAALIATDLINEYGLTSSEGVSSLSDPMLRWIDFVARYISPKPRTIVASHAFPKRLPIDIENALRNLEANIQRGEDVNHFQSKGLVLHNDTSGNKRQSRTDLLWADWGIHHLHLTNEIAPKGSYFSARSNWLLFCLVTDDSIAFIDIRDHSDIDLFSDKELIGLIVRSWPDYMNQYKRDGVLAPDGKTTTQDIAKLRKAGVATVVEVDGHMYLAPGMGVTTASTASKVSSSIVRIRHRLQELAKMVSRIDGQFMTDAVAKGIQEPKFSLTISPQGLSVFEEVGNIAYPLPRSSDEKGKHFLGELHDLLLPEWALRRLLHSTREA